MKHVPSLKGTHPGSPTGPNPKGMHENGLHYMAGVFPHEAVEPAPAPKRTRRKAKPKGSFGTLQRLQAGGPVQAVPPLPLTGVPTGALMGSAPALPQGGAWPGLPTAALPFGGPLGMRRI